MSMCTAYRRLLARTNLLPAPVTALSQPPIHPVSFTPDQINALAHRSTHSSCSSVALPPTNPPVRTTHPRESAGSAASARTHIPLTCAHAPTLPAQSRAAAHTRHSPPAVPQAHAPTAYCQLIRVRPLVRTNRASPAQPQAAAHTSPPLTHARAPTTHRRLSVKGQSAPTARRPLTHSRAPITRAHHSPAHTHCPPPAQSQASASISPLKRAHLLSICWSAPTEHRQVSRKEPPAITALH